MLRVKGKDRVAEGIERGERRSAMVVPSDGGRLGQLRALPPARFGPFSPQEGPAQEDASTCQLEMVAPKGQGADSKRT